jgi:hypothetical protein
MNLLGDNIDNVKEAGGNIIGSNREFHVEIKEEKIIIC